ASGQMRIAKSGSCSLNVSRHAVALPICLSSSIMSSAIRPPKRLVLDYFRYPPPLGEAVSVAHCSAKNAWPPQPKTLPEMGTKLIFCLPRAETNEIRTFFAAVHEAGFGTSGRFVVTHQSGRSWRHSGHE